MIIEELEEESLQEPVTADKESNQLARNKFHGR